MIIRSERDGDESAVRSVNVAAFGTAVEADLVDALRQQARPLVSLVAEDAGAIVGHVMFSPVVLTGHPERRMMGLAPMAVVPARQRSGVGSALVSAGLDACRRIGAGAVVVLGHPTYYPRFGFVPAARFGMRCEYEVPEDTFMLLELERGHLKGAAGIVSYHAAFRAL